MKTNSSFIDIDQNALQHNLQRVRELAPNSKILAMIKANGYGHGLVTVAKSLNNKADAFGVACLAEALQLRNAGITNRIVLMRGVYTVDELSMASQYHIELVVHQPEQIDLLEQQQHNFPKINYWLKINTGMNRLGFSSPDAISAYERLKKLNNLQQLILMTHFASSEDMSLPTTKMQMQLFRELTKNFPEAKSLANSGAILLWPDSHADWVRPGLMLYGVSPIPGHTGAEHGLLPVMTWRSELLVVRQQKKGDKIGYGGIGTCSEDMPIGIVGVGYADGYPRHAKNGTPLLVNEKQVPLLGRVSMDMLAVDLRQVPDAKIGDSVVLWGKNLPIEYVADCAETIAYELLCHAHLRS